MWEYKVVTGTYTIDGAHVIIKNPAGQGTLQQALDLYGADRWELVSTHLDGVQREVVLILKRAKGGVVAPVVAAGAAAPVAAAPVAAAPARASFVDPDGEVVRRRTPGSPPAGGGRTPSSPSTPVAAPPSGTPGRRSRRDLDKLMRDD